jgi:hypothetical protein
MYPPRAPKNVLVKNNEDEIISIITSLTTRTCSVSTEFFHHHPLLIMNDAYVRVLGLLSALKEEDASSALQNFDVTKNDDECGIEVVATSTKQTTVLNLDIDRLDALAWNMVHATRIVVLLMAFAPAEEDDDVDVRSGIISFFFNFVKPKLASLLDDAGLHEEDPYHIKRDVLVKQCMKICYELADTLMMEEEDGEADEEAISSHKEFLHVSSPTTTKENLPPTRFLDGKYTSISKSPVKEVFSNKLSDKNSNNNASSTIKRSAWV